MGELDGRLLSVEGVLKLLKDIKQLKVDVRFLEQSKEPRHSGYFQIEEP